MYDVAFIIGSEIRRKILQRVESPATVKMITKEFETHMSSVSRAMRELEEKKMVKCLNPKNDRNRFYQITPKGKSVLKKVEKVDSSSDK